MGEHPSLLIGCASTRVYACKAADYWIFLRSYLSPPAPLQTEFSLFCEVKYLLKQKTHNKDEENTLKELNEIFLTVYGLPK